ncbi:MAG: hypothetical protein AB7K09_11740 [Planctomycetota bacterium]
MTTQPDTANPDPTAAPAPSALDASGPPEQTMLAVFVGMALFTICVAAVIIGLVAADTRPAIPPENLSPSDNGPWHLRPQPGDPAR